jgi:hypothetical protein
VTRAGPAAAPFDRRQQGEDYRLKDKLRAGLREYPFLPDEGTRRCRRGDRERILLQLLTAGFGTTRKSLRARIISAY